MQTMCNAVIKTVNRLLLVSRNISLSSFAGFTGSYYHYKTLYVDILCLFIVCNIVVELTVTVIQNQLVNCLEHLTFKFSNGVENPTVPLSTVSC